MLRIYLETEGSSNYKNTIRKIKLGSISRQLFWRQEWNFCLSYMIQKMIIWLASTRFSDVFSVSRIKFIVIFYQNHIYYCIEQSLFSL